MITKEKKYIFYNIILPILIILILPYLILKLLNLNEIINEIGIGNISIRLNNLPKESIFVLLAIFFYIMIRKYNESKEFFKGNLYGSNNYYIYILAKILGFKKICLKRKPYYIIFKILLNQDFPEILELEEENKHLSSQIAIISSYEKEDINNELKEFNLIISDTYQIIDKQIPFEKRNINTIRITRRGGGENRISSDLLVHAVKKAVRHIIKTDSKINLFMTTSTYNTYKIVTDSFMQSGRDNLRVEIFQQGRDKERAFEKKGKKI